ncbi:hypothetical protein [Ferruginibacter profundus]
MKRVFNILTCAISLSALIRCSGQINKPEHKGVFEKIEIGNFEPKSKDDSLLISSYAIITADGKVTNFELNKREDTIAYFTTTLPDTLLNKIQKLFNEKTTLKSYEKIKKAEANEIYVGDYIYLKVKYQNNKVDSLCTILNFLNNEFNDVFDSFVDFDYYLENQKTVPKFKISDQFKSSLYGAYKRSNYLPQIKTLPPLQ